MRPAWGGRSRPRPKPAKPTRRVDSAAATLSEAQAPLRFAEKRSPAVRVDPTKSETVVVIHASVARLSPITLRRLREGLFRLELQLIEDMVITGIDVPKVTAISHVCGTIEAVDQLAVGRRERL